MVMSRSIKSKLKKMRDPILEQMAIEQAFQADLRHAMVRATSEEEIESIRLKFDESVKHWKVLAASLEEYERLNTRKWNVSWDTLLVVGGNLLGIAMILYKEKMDIVTSKALGFVLRGRV